MPATDPRELDAPLAGTFAWAADGRVFAVSLALCLAATAAILLAIVIPQHGIITYGLDDTFIHLSLSEHIARLHYGMNAGEATSASSSILWPFLLAIGAGAPIHPWLPFLYNTLAMAASVALLAEFTGMIGPVGATLGWRIALTTIMTLALNLVGLIFVGMEHSIQVLSVLATLIGLIRVLDGGRAPAWLWIALIAGPLMRYETLGLALPALGVAWLAGERRGALVTGAILIVLVGGFSLFLHALGLGYLPNSAIQKTSYGGADPIGHFIALRLDTWSQWQGLVLLALFGLLGANVIRGPRRNERLIAAVAMIGIGFQLLFGRNGNFDRYEAYADAAGLVALAYGWRDLWRGSAARGGAFFSGALLGLVIIGLFLPNLMATAFMPVAARSIYLRQWQLRDFVVAYWRGDVAVSDLGVVSYRNPNYVLDLWGLAQGEVGWARLDGEARWPDGFVQQRHVGLAIIIDTWFAGHIPAGWTRLGEIAPTGSICHFGMACEPFAIYATRPDAVAPARAALARFIPTLPAGVRFTPQPGA